MNFLKDNSQHFFKITERYQNDINSKYCRIVNLLSYQPFSLLPSFGKLLEKLTYKHILGYFNRYSCSKSSV